MLLVGSLWVENDHWPNKDLSFVGFQTNLGTILRSPSFTTTNDDVAHLLFSTQIVGPDKRRLLHLETRGAAACGNTKDYGQKILIYLTSQLIFS